MLNVTRKWLTTAAVAVTAIGGLLIPGSPANAAVVKGHICLKNSSSYCLQSNGAGNQVTITNNSSKYAVFTVVFSISMDGITSFEWENASGNCLEEDGDLVTIKDGGCSGSDRADSWDDNAGVLVNDSSTHHSMLVRGQPQTGSKVFAYATIASGDWAKWSVP